MSRKERLSVLSLLMAVINLTVMVPALVGHPLPAWLVTPLTGIGLGFLIGYWVECYDKGSTNG